MPPGRRGPPARTIRSAPRTLREYRAWTLLSWLPCRSRLLQLRRGTRQHLDQLGFGVGIVREPLCRDVAQIVDRRPQERRDPGAAAVVVVTTEAPPHARRALADRGQALEHGIDEIAVLVEVGTALRGDGVELLRALDFGGDVARLLEIGEGGIDDARARRVPARRILLQHLDDLVAVARLLQDERERDPPQVALRQHAPGAHHVATAEAVAPSAPAMAGMPAPAAARRPLTLEWRTTGMSHAEHVGLLCLKRYIVRYIQNRCSTRYIFKMEFYNNSSSLAWMNMRNGPARRPQSARLRGEGRSREGGRRLASTRRGGIRRSDAYGAIAWRARATMSFGAA